MTVAAEVKTQFDVVYIMPPSHTHTHTSMLCLGPQTVSVFSHWEVTEGARGPRARSELPRLLIGSLHGGVHHRHSSLPPSLSPQEGPLMGHCSGLMAISFGVFNNFFPTVKKMEDLVCGTAETLLKKP